MSQKFLKKTLSILIPVAENQKEQKNFNGEARSPLTPVKFLAKNGDVSPTKAFNYLHG